jgi:hypothetical protein
MLEHTAYYFIFFCNISFTFVKVCFQGYTKFQLLKYTMTMQAKEMTNVLKKKNEGHIS